MSTDFKSLIISVLSGRDVMLRPEELAAKAGVDTGDMADLMNILDEMEKEGSVYVTRRGKYFIPDTEGLVPAVIVTMLQNFSFARPKNGGEDIYISNHSLHGALPGDTVLLNVKAKARGTYGGVERIIARGSHEFAGKIVKAKRGYAVEVKSAVRYPIPLEPSKKRHRVAVGEKVKIRIVNRGRNKQDEFYAKILNVYGDADSARVCADSIIDLAGIPVEFSVAVREQAQAINEKGISPEDYKNRLDLREVPVFTIDGADAKDLDDAVSIQPKAGGGWELGVHIADVSHYVQAGTPLDREAMERGTSVYFADRVIPMLPEELSNGICSLNSGVDRLTFSALIDLDAQGEITHFEFRKTIINSKVRGVYSEVNSILDKSAEEGILKKYHAVLDIIAEMKKCAEVLKAGAKRRGALGIDTKESKIYLDENGVACAVEPRIRGEAEEIIEQFMITANVAAARLAEEAGIPFVYRIHEQPKEERLMSLKETVQLFGMDAKNIHGESTPADLAQLLEKARGTKYSRVLSEETLRTLAKARYAPQCIGHFGLALSHYSHFTSPIRRYPDLSIHRILTEFISGVKGTALEKKYGVFAVKSSELSTDCEIRAMNAERDCEDCYKAEYMKSHVGEIFDGVISSVTAHGIYVELENSVEGMMRPEELLGGSFRFDGKLSYLSSTGKKKYSVGDSICVQVTRADVSSGQIDFLMVESCEIRRK